MSTMLLNDKVCVVTGGATGIGRAVVERFLLEGAKGLVVVDRNTDALRDLEIINPGKVVPVRGDVRDYETHSRAATIAIDSFGQIDSLVANAGIFDFRKPIQRYSPTELSLAFEELFSINVKGYIFAIAAMLSELRKARGSIVLTGSVASCHAGGGGVLYTAAKHAVVGLARQAALELAPEVRVNVVAPGGTDTNLGGIEALGSRYRAINDRADFRDRVAALAPLGFAQKPEDHAGAYAFLASNIASPAVTGDILMSDGGFGIRKY